MKDFEMNKKKITTYQNLYNVTKTVLSEKCLAINIYIKKEEISQINNLFLYLKELVKEYQIKTKASQKEIIKIRVEIN